MFRLDAISMIKKLVAFSLCCLTIPAFAEKQITISTMGEGIEFPTKSINVRILREAYHRIGYSLKIVELPAARALYQANEGEYDGEAFRKKGLEKHFPNLVMVPFVLYQSEFVAFTKRDDITITDCNSLKPFRIVIERGIINSENCVEGFDYVQKLRNEEQLFRVVDLDRADIAIDERQDGAYLMKKQNISSLHVQGEPLVLSTTYHYLHKKNKALVPAMTNALQQMQKEGLIEQYKNEVLASMGLK